MRVRYIAIEREYGSGGTKIAAEVAKKCGIPSYGREIMETVAKEQNVSVETLEGYEESVSGSFLYSMFVMSQSQTGNPDLLSPEAKLYVAETRVIKNLASHGPGIFVGHCASESLKDLDGVLRVFIRANDEDKEKRAGSGITESRPIRWWRCAGKAIADGQIIIPSVPEKSGTTSVITISFWTAPDLALKAVLRHWRPCIQVK